MRIARVVRTAKVSGPCISNLFAGALLVGLVSSILASAASAASISYGNFGPVPPGVMFLDVKESSSTDAVPLYGAPTPFSVGLDFDPTLGASAAGGSTDITDGQLNFTVMGLSNRTGSIGIGGINLSEAGDYTLAGGGGPPTSVTAGAIIRATVTHINGAPVAPFDLVPSSNSFSDSLPGPVVVAPWSLGVFLDIGGQLANFGYGPDSVATKVKVSINNALVATSEPNSASFIAKKRFTVRFRPDPVGDIPEPTSLALVGVMVGLLGLATRRRFD